MHITPNNKLSNHYVKRKVEKTVWIEDQTVSGSFYQNMGIIHEKTKRNMFYEDYINPVFSFSNNYCSDVFSVCSDLLSSDSFGINPYDNNINVVGVGGMNNIYGNVGCDVKGLGENNAGSVFVRKNEDGNSIINILFVDEKDANGNYAIEFTNYTDPLNPDIDGDGLYDGYDITDDYGNIIKGELSHNCYPLSPDTDRDGMPDGEEVRNGLNPNPVHSLKIPTLLMLPENGGAIYSSMLEQVDLYIFIMTVSGSISDL